MLEARGVPLNNKELLHCKQRLEKTRQQSAYIPQLDVPEEELFELQSMLEQSLLDDEKEQKQLEPKEQRVDEESPSKSLALQPLTNPYTDQTQIAPIQPAQKAAEDSD